VPSHQVQGEGHLCSHGLIAPLKNMTMATGGRRRVCVRWQM
jgi:hypothetical protein